MMLLNSVAEVRLKEKQEYIKVAQQQTDSNKTTLKDQKRSIEEDNPEKPEPQNVENVNESSVTEKSITETGSEEAGNIRVLLMTTDYQSYFHPQVTALRDGKEIICDFESMSVSEEPMVIPAHKNGIQLTSLERQCGNPVYQGTIEIQRTDQGFTG